MVKKKRELIGSLIDKDLEQFKLFEFNNAISNEIFSLKTLKSKRKAIYVYDYKLSTYSPNETIYYLKNLQSYKKRIKNFNNLIYQIYSFLDNKHRLEIIEEGSKKYIKLDLLLNEIKNLEILLKMTPLNDIDSSLNKMIKDFFLSEYNITIYNTELFLYLNYVYYLNKIKVLK